MPNISGLDPVVDDVASAPSEIAGRGTRRTRISRARLYLRRFLRNRGAVVGLAVLALLVLFALFGSLLTAHTYLDVDFADLSSSPSPEHPFGTNGAGNDTCAQAVHGLQRSLVIALVVSAATTMIAAFVGAAAAYLGGRVETITLAVIHFLLVMPAFLILALVSQRAHGQWPVLILVLTVFGWMFNARVVWSVTTSLREREYVQAARYMGVGRIRIVLRHLIPNLGSLLIVSFTLGVGGDRPGRDGTLVRRVRGPAARRLAGHDAQRRRQHGVQRTLAVRRSGGPGHPADRVRGTDRRRAARRPRPVLPLGRPGVSLPVLAVRDLRVSFPSEAGRVDAVRGVDFDLLPGRDAGHRR